MNKINLDDILAQISVPYGWELESVEEGDTIFLRVLCNSDRCNITNEEMNWTGRKWVISRYACESEIVQTCLKAILTAVEHETREKFLYKGRMIFGPHIDVNVLLRISDYVEKRAVKQKGSYLMANEIDDGGPAFPSHGTMGEREHCGMSLRDWYAGQALIGLASGSQEIELDVKVGESVKDARQRYWQNIAYGAYVIADALIAAKRKSEEG